jgi:cysteine desulfurase
LIVALGKACEIAARDLDQNRARMREMRDRLHQGLAAGLAGLRLNGHPKKRLPNTLSLSFKGVAADRLLATIGDEIAASAGAACHADTVTISHVLQAMRVPDDWARGTIRFSVGRTTTEEDIDAAVPAIIRAVKRLQEV